MHSVIAAPVSLRAEVIQLAQNLGFCAVGFARADRPLDRDFDRYQAFVAAGFAGELSYLTQNVQARKTLAGSEILPGAKSVICLAASYARSTVAADPPLPQQIARYARGRDYHNVVRKKLRKIVRLIKQRMPGERARTLCDVEPLLERAWAARAGIGFIGKNGLLIVPKSGSMVVLGEVVTTVDFEPDDPQIERCGSCRLCLDVCPTNAFAAPWQLDPRKCVSYWSIEVPELPPPELLDALSDRLFGCDDCQTVCPYNRADVTADSPWSIPLDILHSMELDDVLTLDEKAFETMLMGSPLKRATLAGLQRNAVFVAAGRLRRDRSDPRATRALALAENHHHPLVRQAWLLVKGDAATEVRHD